MSLRGVTTGHAAGRDRSESGAPDLVLDPATIPHEDAGLHRLTPRQREVLALLAAGATCEEAMYALGIKRMTFYDHLRAIRARLDVHTSGEAVALWYGGEPYGWRRKEHQQR